jgi:threonylcarbamoyladenosine tRNA methylthiotransferase MtaB
MTFNIITLGCKVNAYESEIMRELMEDAGYLIGDKENSDITIINTCSVTNMADKKSQKIVRHIKRINPNTILIVAGCSSENQKELYEKMNIDILLGNKDKSQIVPLINEFLSSKKPIIDFYHTRNLPFEDMTINRFKSHTRAFLKIQDGCNNFCSYCIIPYVRGTIRSKDFKKTLEEAKILVDNGHSEIVLTGIHTGSYGFGTKNDLTDLIHEMSKLQSLKRIRLSSIEITELNDKFLQELKNNPKICNHLHIPLQAGSDEILIKMNRKYNLKYFEKKLKEIRNIRPNISITTDIIVGHPFETEDLFQETLKNAQKFQFSKIHAFPYSKRTGTKAALMEGQVEEDQKKERNRKLLELSALLENQYAKSFLNQTLMVLIEENKDGYSLGHTENYLKIKVFEHLEPNHYYQVKLLQMEKDCIHAKLIS